MDADDPERHEIYKRNENFQQKRWQTEQKLTWKIYQMPEPNQNINQDNFTSKNSYQKTIEPQWFY